MSLAGRRTTNGRSDTEPHSSIGRGWPALRTVGAPRRRDRRPLSAPAASFFARSRRHAQDKIKSSRAFLFILGRGRRPRRPTSARRRAFSLRRRCRTNVRRMRCRMRSIRHKRVTPPTGGYTSSVRRCLTPSPQGEGKRKSRPRGGSFHYFVIFSCLTL